VAANLIGFIGLVLAAPVLATLNLLARYVGRKMFDMDPWPASETEAQPQELELPIERWRRRVRALVRFVRRQGLEK
jgi:hypothetical protein